MASQKQQAPQDSQAGANKTKKKGQKIFGVMTKRRWFGVMVFLSAMLWSYTAGPPLPDTIVCNRYFLDGTFYDYKTVRFEGNITLIDKLFKRGFWPDTFTWQIGAYFNWTEGPMWSEKYGKLIFTDVVQNNLFSWSPINGIQIEKENSGDCTAEQLAKLYEPGSNGLLQHPNNPDQVFMAQQARSRIVLYNLQQKKVEKVIVQKYKGKKLNSPNDMAVGPKGQYLYFTDPPYGLREKGRDNPKDPNHGYLDSKSEIGFSGIYKVKLDGSSSAELIDDSLKRPNGIVVSDDGSRLFVSDCDSGTFKINVYKFPALKLEETWTEAKVLRNKATLESDVQPLQGGTGCVDGMALLDANYLITTCPGGKLCILNQQSGDLEALIKLPDKTHLTNVAVGADRNLYVTGNHTVWQIKLQPLA